MRLRALPLIVVLASLTSLASLGCTDDSPTVSPTDGTWNYFEMGVENNTCPDFVDVFAPSTTFLLDYDGGDGFQIEQVDQMDIVCNLVGGPDFVCPGRLLISSDVPDLNLTLDIYVDITGSFDSDREAQGEQHITVECTGDGCGALDDIPCSYDLPFTAEAQ